MSLWPVWPVLIIRSPWHTGFVTGALSWAMLISTVAWIGYLAARPDTPVNPLSMTFQMAPGIALTVLTQYLWARHRALSQPANRSDVEPNDTAEGRPRRRRRRRGGRPGRSSRHPM